MHLEEYKFKMLVWNESGLLLDLRFKDKDLAENALKELVKARKERKAFFSDAYIAEVKN